MLAGNSDRNTVVYNRLYPAQATYIPSRFDHLFIHLAVVVVVVC